MCPVQVLLECAARGMFDFCQKVRVIVSGDDFAKRDARSQPEEFFAAKHLPSELIQEGEALAVRAGFAEPGDGMMKSRLRDNSAGDGDEDLQPGDMLQKDFETA